MKKQRIISWILAIAMLLPLASCSETTVEETKSGAGEAAVEQPAGENEEVIEEETRLPLGVPEKSDFGGQDIKFLVWTHPSWVSTVREYRDIYSEGLNGEAINDTVYNRNLKVQENYNVIISQERMDLGQISGTLSKEVTAGTNTYSVYYPRLYEGASMYQKNYFHNLLDLENLDLTQPWWDTSCVDALSVVGRLPAVATSLNVNDKDATAAVAFNKDAAANYQLEDLYTIVREGRWTYDKVSELADAVDTDTNGDGVMGEDDFLGLLGGNDVMPAFWFGAGSNMITKNENDEFVFSFGSERDIDAAVKVIQMMNQTWFLNHHDSSRISSTDDTFYRQLFENGRALIFWMRLDDVTNMRAGETEFGILPTPKYEEAQNSYYNYVSQHTTGIMSLPITLAGDQLTAVTTVLEAMAYESHYTLIPEYIESSLKTKHSRDAESADMLDIIISSRIWDPMVIYDFGSFNAGFGALGPNNNTDIASFLRKNKKIVEKMIEKFVESQAEME